MGPERVRGRTDEAPLGGAGPRHFEPLPTKAPTADGWRLPALSGALFAVSYFPGPFLALNLAALLPLLAWIEARPGASAYRTLKAGFVFGLVAELMMLHWMYSMLAWSWLAALLYVGLAVALALRDAIIVVLLARLRHRTALPWGLVLPICWISIEWLHSWGDLRLTVNHLAHSVSGYPFLIQFAQLVGPFGVAAVLLATNGLLFETLLRWRCPAGRRAGLALVGLIVAVLAYDTWAWNRPLPQSRRIRIGLVQPNVPLLVKHNNEELARQLETLREQTLEAVSRGAELVIWPETARPTPLYHWPARPETYTMPDVQRLARETGAALVVGVEYLRIRSREDFDLYNAAMAVDAQGRLLEDWGAKINLVPFTEGVPFKSWLGPLVEGKGGEWRWLAGGFDPGPQSALIRVAGAKIGALVCYEEFFPDLARQLRNAGSDLQIVITNDAWFGRSLFQPFLVNALRLRAIENRISYVRVANTGISGFVDSRGRYRHRTPLFEKAVEVADVLLSDEPTLYDRIGDVVAWLAVAGLVLALIVSRNRRG